MIKVFDGQSADGDSTVLKSPGGLLKVSVEGDFGGGTVTTKTSPDGGTTYITVGTDGVFTADGQVSFATAPGERVRLTLAGSTSPDLNAWAGPTEHPDLTGDLVA